MYDDWPNQMFQDSTALDPFSMPEAGPADWMAPANTGALSPEQRELAEWLALSTPDDGGAGGYRTDADYLDDVIIIADDDGGGYDPWWPYGPGGGGGGGGGGGDEGGGWGGGGGGGSSNSGQTTDGQPPEKDCKADDQARAALEMFLEDAAARDEFFGVRERGAFIVRNDDGSYSLTNFEVGPSVFSAEGAGVMLNTMGLTPSNVIGYVHSHPSDSTLSGPDRDIVVDFQDYISDNGGSHEFRMYLITNDQQISVYDKDNMNEEQGVDVTDDCT